MSPTLLYVIFPVLNTESQYCYWDTHILFTVGWSFCTVSLFSDGWSVICIEYCLLVSSLFSVRFSGNRTSALYTFAVVRGSVWAASWWSSEPATSRPKAAAVVLVLAEKPLLVLRPHYGEEVNHTFRGSLTIPAYIQERDFCPPDSWYELFNHRYFHIYCLQPAILKLCCGIFIFFFVKFKCAKQVLVKQNWQIKVKIPRQSSKVGFAHEVTGLAAEE